MNKILNNVDECTGCNGCKNVCPKQCIFMKMSDDGFYYPQIEHNLCVECGLCAMVCPINNTSFHSNPESIIAYKNDNDVREQSTSGGFFTAISDYILNKNGVVYGAIFDQNFKVMHQRANDIATRNAMRYSKYVQSDIGKTYSRAGEDLLNKKTVLFTGTPCQISGLNNYLSVRKISNKNLITCDFICHGTPSPLIWENYLSFIHTKYNDNILAVNFRDKTLGWHKPQLKIIMEHHTQSGTEAQDAFYQLFYSNCILRKSCHICPYTSIKRVSDITMADFWGVENSYPQLDDNKGLSLLLINSQKGADIIGKLGIQFDEIRLEDIRQPHLYHPALASRKRDKFWNEYSTKGFMYVLNKYGNQSIKSKIIRRVKKAILKVMK